MKGTSLSPFIISSVVGLYDEELQEVNDLLKVWRSKHFKNQLLNVYYDGHRTFRDLGVSIPPQMSKTKAALGWPSKAVLALARKHVFEGYSLGDQSDPFEIDGILRANDFYTGLSQAFTSAYKHSCSFVTVTPDAEDSELMGVNIQFRSADWSAAKWDNRSRRISSFLTISSVDKNDRPNHVVVFLPGVILEITRPEGSSEWRAERYEQKSQRVLVEVLSSDPQLNRPFGRSRITREVRYLTDAAIRTMVRSETSAEFFSSPQRYVLGAPEGAFEGQNKWSAIMGRIMALEVTEEGTLPNVGQFPQMSMEPHLSMYRQLAQNLCSATNLPQSAVGLFADNPASAEAMQAAESALSDEAEYQWRIFESPLRRVAQNIVMVRDELSEPPVGSWDLSVNWTPTRYSSPSASADFISKVVQSIPKVAESSVALRRSGFTQAEVDQINSESRVSRAASALNRISNR